MSMDLYQKLVDLYVGEELPTELAEELEQAAINNPELSHDLFTLRQTLMTLKAQSQVEFTEESHYRILQKMQAQGAEVETQAPEPAYWQYQLPIQG